MKKKIRDFLWPLGLSILCGFILGRYYFNTYRNSLERDLTSKKLYLIESGEYDTFNDMRNNNTNSYVYYKDNNKYKSVVGITSNYDNVEKIKKLYDGEVSEYFIASDKIDSKQEEYDMELASTDDIESVKEIIDNILNLYKSDDEIKLVGID